MAEPLAPVQTISQPAACAGIDSFWAGKDLGMGQETSKSGAPPSQAQQQPHTHLPVIDSRGLFGNCNEVRLRHRGKEYRLRITRQGKLILTK